MVQEALTTEPVTKPSMDQLLLPCSVRWTTLMPWSLVT